ncbi:MAG: multidrug efflux system membrane fusion protein [Saprospiraceae bacterium]|jgi:multidrug efflux system membrane fusion protein
MTKYIFLIIVLISSTSCKKEIEALKTTKSALNYTLVEIELVEYSNEPIAINSIGQVASDKELKLSFKVGGIVSSISVDEGDYVRAGTLLGTMRTNEIDAQVLKAESALSKAQRDLDRTKKMYADDAATLENVQDLETLVAVSQADVDIAQFNQKYASISSPISGRVLKRMAEPNELVSPGQPILIIASSGSGSYIMKASLSDKNIASVALGNKTTMTFDAFQDETFHGSVINIAESADPRTGMFDVDISILKSKRRMRNGLIGRISIIPSQEANYIKIPLDAVVDINGKQITVFSPSQEDTIAKAIQITPLHIQQDYMLLRAPDTTVPDRLITTGAAYLRDGSRIKIKS